MNFKEEYKKSAESLSPDRQTIDRMKAAVMAKLNEEPSEEEPKPKKPLPLKRIAYIGGAAAACAIITISAVTVIPMLRKNNDMVSEASEAVSSTAASLTDSANGFAGNSADSAMQENAPDSVVEPATANAQEESSAELSTEDFYANGPVSDKGNAQTGVGDAVTYPTDDVDEAEDVEATGDGSGISSGGSIQTGETAEADDDHPGNPMTGAPDDMFPDSGATAEPAYEATMEISGDATMEISGAETMEGFPETLEKDNEGTLEMAEATCEFATLDAVSTECCDETQEAPPTYKNLLVITGKGWLTCNGKRYDQTAAADPGLFAQTEQAYNAADGKYYAIYLDNGTLYLYQNDGKFLGSFAERK